MRLWCVKLKLSKAYLGLAGNAEWKTRWFSSRGAVSHHHYILTNNGSTNITTWLERYVAGRTWMQNPILGEQHITVSSNVAQNVSIETFDSLCDQGNAKEAVEVFNCLEKKGYAIDLVRLLRLAKLCSEQEALEEAKVVHECIISLVSPSDVSSRNVIIEMYSGCGSVDDSLKVFDEMPEKHSETWCVMMRCFVNNGYGSNQFVYPL